MSNARDVYLGAYYGAQFAIIESISGNIYRYGRESLCDVTDNVNGSVFCGIFWACQLRTVSNIKNEVCGNSIDRCLKRY